MKLFYKIISHLYLIILILFPSLVIAQNKNIEKDILNSFKAFSEQDFVKSKEYLKPHIDISLVAKFHYLQLSNPTFKRKGAQNWDFDYKSEYEKIIFELENSDQEIELYENKQNFLCLVVNSYIFNIIKENEGTENLSGVSDKLFNCLGNGDATFFSGYAPLIILEFALTENEDKLVFANRLYATAIRMVQVIQTSLTLLDYDIGKIDGMFGNNSQSALINYQMKKGLPIPSGSPSLSIIKMLYEDVQERTDISIEDKGVLESYNNKLTLLVKELEDFGYFSLVEQSNRGETENNSKSKLTSKLDEKIDLGLDVDQQWWESIKDRTDPEFFKLYMEQFPNGRFFPLAELYFKKYSQSEELEKKDVLNVNSKKIKYKALIIANQNYTVWQKLKTPIQDQIKVSSILKNKYKFDEVIEKTDLTRTEFLRSVDAFFKNAEENDHLILYYAGHGEKYGENKGYWLPVNAKKHEDYDWIDISRIQKYAKESKAKKILFIVDSCFAGMIKRGWKDLQQALGFGQDNEEVDNDNFTRVAITSGDINQSASDVDNSDKRFSPFSKALNSALEEFQGNFLSYELFNKLLEKFPKDLEQTPTFAPLEVANHSSGDFEFIIN